MRLTAYLLKIVLVRFAVCFGLIGVVYLSIDLVESSSMTTASFSQLMAAYPFKLPAMSVHIAPIAAVLAVLLGYGHMVAHGEWSALRAAGISTVSVCAKLLVLPVCAGALLVPVASMWAPWGLARYESVCAPQTAPESPEGAWTKEGDWLVRRSGDGGLFLKRDSAGEVLLWVEKKPEVTRVWRPRAGWSDDPGVLPQDSFSQREENLSPGAFGLVGAGITSSRLSELVAELDSSGREPFALVAQIELRPVMACAAFIIPLAALLLAVGWRVEKPARLVPLGLFCCAGYWGMASAGWNLVVSGAGPGWFLWPGIPVVWMLMSALFLVWGLARGT